jgi:osmotically-inducible protein OsmY
MPTYKSDEQIKQEVLRELRWDTRVNETEIGVIVHQGLVTLTGAVESYGKKLAAQDAAHRVAGVLDVANEVQVQLPGLFAHTDAEIAQAARRALEWDVLVPADSIQSSVSDGWITLTGTVEYMGEREDAERAVRHLRGVKGVINQIAIAEKEVEPNEVRAIIEEALERRADREAKRIKVTVENGVVTLAGVVRNWAERRAIIGAVSHTPGVHTVHDHMRIDPYYLAVAAAAH